MATQARHKRRGTHQRFTRTLLFVAFLATALPSFPASAASLVDLELVLAIDCSYSVNRREYRQQVLGLSEAFRSPEVLQAIKEGPHGAIAVSVIQWSNSESTLVTLPWTRIDSQRTAQRLATQLRGMRRRATSGGTSISAAIRISTDYFRRSPFRSQRKVIDVSGDGRNNSGWGLELVRKRAVDRGITINGLAILNDVATLHLYFQQRVIGGTGAFVISAKDYDDYVSAIRRKLLAEIGNVPVSLKGKDDEPSAPDSRSAG